MDIVFENARLRKQCNSQKELVRRHGPRRAKVLRRRLDELAAATSLEQLRELPGRCHELTGDRKGQLSIDLDGPHRLLFRPADNPAPLRPDGGLDWRQVTAIAVLGIADTHE